MARAHSHGELQRSRKVKPTVFPKVMVDVENDFAVIRLADGIESHSYAKDGFVFCEDADGRIIEVQILNLSRIRKPRSKSSRVA